MTFTKIYFLTTLTLIIIIFSLNGIAGSDTLALVAEEIRGTPVLLESPLGNLVADAMRFQTNTEIAFVPNGNLGAGFKQGPLTEDLIIRAIVYPDDHIIVAYLRGSEILQILEQSLSLYPYSNARFLQLSGIKVQFSTQIGPTVFGGSGRLRNVFIGGHMLNLEQTYRCSMLLPMAQGFLGYPPFGRDITDTNVAIAQAVASFARIKQVLRYEVEGRINIIP